VRRQCALLNVPRGRLYYTPTPEKPENLKMMTILDKHLTDHPTEGSRSARLLLRDKGYPVGRNRVRRLLRIMGRETIYRRKSLTKLGSREYIRPYLLRDYRFERVNQVWCTDITYIPMKHGFMYLTAVMDIYSRRILSWGISNTMEASWCVQVLSDAVARHGKPEIINSDQGSQYTSIEWTRYVENHLEARISMDGKGRTLDNVWIERFWKTIKYDYIYLHPADDGSELFEGVQNHIGYYNQKHHQTLKTSPDKLYQKSMETLT
jgi:putative transposase